MFERSRLLPRRHFLCQFARRQGSTLTTTTEIVPPWFPTIRHPTGRTRTLTTDNAAPMPTARTQGSGPWPARVGVHATSRNPGPPVRGQPDQTDIQRGRRKMLCGGACPPSDRADEHHRIAAMPEIVEADTQPRRCPEVSRSSSQMLIRPTRVGNHFRASRVIAPDVEQDPRHDEKHDGACHTPHSRTQLRPHPEPEHDHGRQPDGP